MVIAVVAVTVAVRITISSLSVLHLTSLLRVGLKSSRAGGRGGGGGQVWGPWASKNKVNLVDI